MKDAAQIQNDLEDLGTSNRTVAFLIKEETNNGMAI